MFDKEKINIFMKFKNIFFVSFLALSGACAQAPDIESEMAFEESQFMNTSDIVKDYELIPLELTEDNQILDATVVRLVKDRIYILDCYSPINKTLHVFNMEGKYIGHVGSSGQGPGEYIMPQNFMINEHEGLILIRDIATNKLISYNIETLEFVNEYPLSFYSTCSELAGDNQIVWYVGSGLRNEGEMQKHIQISDTKGEVQKSLIDRLDFPARGLFNIMTCFMKYQGKVYFHHPFLNDYFVLNEDGVTPAFALSFNHHQFPTSDYLTENNEEITDKLMEDGYIQYCDALMSDHALACYFGIDKTIYWGIYNRKSKKGKYIDRSKINDDLGLGLLGRPKTVFDDQFVTIVSTESIETLPENSILYQLGAETIKNSNLVVLLFNP